MNNTEKALINVVGFGFKEFIEKAIEGGWEPHRYVGELVHDLNKFGLSDEETALILQDPSAWRAVGKVEGWEGEGCMNCKEFKKKGLGEHFCIEGSPSESRYPEDHYRYHQFIDELYKLTSDGK